jgi:hypothetical protein
VDNKLSAAWLRADHFEKFPVDFSLNFIPGSQYWTQLADGLSFSSESVRRYPSLHVAIRHLYGRFSKGTLEDYDFAAGSGYLNSRRDLQLAIWNVQHDMDMPTKADDPRSQDWTSAVDTAAGSNGNPMGDSGGTLWSSSNSQYFSSSAFGGGGGGGSGSGNSADSGVVSGRSIVNALARSASSDPSVTGAVAPLPLPFWGGLALMAIVFGWRAMSSRKPVVD